MDIGFFSYPYSVDLVDRLAAAADAHGYDMIGIADAPGNALDPWVAAAMAAARVKQARIGLVVTNTVTRAPAVSAAAIASLDRIAPGRTVLGIGTGHSGAVNIGVERASLAEMTAGVKHIQALLTGAPDSLDGAPAHLPWVARPVPVFMAASGPKTLARAGEIADGVFVNYGIAPDTVAQAEARVAAGVAAAGRDPADVEIWQIATLDCNEDGEAARKKAGAVLAFMAGGYIFRAADLAAQGVPEEYHAPLKELRTRYSTRPGAADAALVEELGLFDYLAERFSIFGTPDDCLKRLIAAHEAGVKRLMLSVSVATDPARAVELFGREVLPRFRKRVE